MNQPVEQQEASPLKNATQHSQTISSNSEDEEEGEQRIIEILETMEIKNR